MTRQTSMNLTPATEAQLDYLKAKGFGGTTDIVRIAIDRMATQEGKTRWTWKSRQSKFGGDGSMTKTPAMDRRFGKSMKVLTGGFDNSANLQTNNPPASTPDAPLTPGLFAFTRPSRSLAGSGAWTNDHRRAGRQAKHSKAT